MSERVDGWMGWKGERWSGLYAILYFSTFLCHIEQLTTNIELQFEVLKKEKSEGRTKAFPNSK